MAKQGVLSAPCLSASLSFVTVAKVRHDGVDNKHGYDKIATMKLKVKKTVEVVRPLACPHDLPA